MRLICVNDDVPQTTVALLREACTVREVAFIEIDAPGFVFDPAAGLARGDMMYRPAVSATAARVEQYLWHEGVATFHADPLGPFFATLNYPLLFQKAGLPVPRSLPVANTERDIVGPTVEALGGFPLAVKLLGFEGGTGTLRVDSFPALYSLLDHVLAEGRQPFLCAFIDDAVHWRCTVVGAQVVAAHRNTPRRDDFRTHVSEDVGDYTTAPDAAVADLAVAAVKALRLEFGGVDILEHPSGRLYLLEANFPCYFADAQELAGIDVAGAMVEHLMGKARALRAGETPI